MRFILVFGWLTFLSACLDSGGDTEPRLDASQGPPVDCGAATTITVWGADPRVMCTDDAETTDALNCFDAAWTRCAAATLACTYSGIDSFITHAYSIRSTSSGCVVDVVITDSANVGLPPSATFTCSANPVAAPDCVALPAQVCPPN